jgi:hypothetical protein
MTGGPGVVAEIRHRLTHPKDTTSIYAVEHLSAETARLACRYLELRSSTDRVRRPRPEPD